jgi:Flp pilus assembly protein TadD
MVFGKLSSLLERPPLIDSTLRPKIYLSLCCFLLLSWGSWKAWSAYQEKQQKHWVTTAEVLLEKNDWRGASVAARRALYLHKLPALDLRATVIMAKICREFEISQEVYWRSELVRLQPDSLQAKEDLIQTAIRYNSLPLAEQTLSSIPPSDRENASFHQLMATYALASQQPDYAQAALREALKREPESKEIRLNLAKVLLSYGPTSTYPEAQNLLDSLPLTSENTSEILRSKIEASKLNNNPAEALILSTTLLSTSMATFNDKVNHLDLLLLQKSPLYPEFLLNLQQESLSRPAWVYQLASKLRTIGQAAEALRWLDTFPENSRTTPPLSILWAECAVTAQEWARLKKSLEEQDWGEMESLRLAFLAKAEKELISSTNPSDSSLLQKSLALAKTNPSLSLTLGDLLSSWSWNESAVEAWWQASRSPQSKLALGKLFEFYKQDRNLNGIWRVSKTASEMDPTDLIARNNFAMSSLILGKGVDAAAATARDLYLKNPEIPAFASTFGLALLLQKKNAEALAIFQKLPPALLQDPGVAPYYVLALAQNKRFQEASSFRSYVQPSSLFPEELALYQKTDRTD